jgi:hypothetical protein
MPDSPNKTHLDDAVRACDGVIRALCTRPNAAEPFAEGLQQLAQCQAAFCGAFSTSREPVEFWETLWRETDLLRDQWLRVKKTLLRVGEDFRATWLPVADGAQRDLYLWTRDTIEAHAPVTPTAAHFELGIGTKRNDCRGLHERIEGLYESVKRMGELPVIREGLDLPEAPNFGIIYGGGWNVSSYSLLRAGDACSGLNTVVAFDHPGDDLYGQCGCHTVRLAPAALVRQRRDPEAYCLGTFREPLVLHFVCPHQWAGTPVPELGIPCLRSDPTLAVVNNKLATTRALAWYARSSKSELPLIPERGVPQAPIPADLEALGAKAEQALDELVAEGITEIVAKPASGEQSRGLGYFTLPAQRQEAVAHAVRLGLESDVVFQQRVRPHPEIDFNWRVLVALAPYGQPIVVGRFARKGRGDDVEMVADREMLRQAGVTGADADALLKELNRVSSLAFRAVSGFACREGDPPRRPLGGGSYAVPYFLGIDLIGNARIMEINGDEVAGMWTDDRLYPGTRGRSNRIVLESARAAAEGYRRALRRAR